MRKEQLIRALGKSSKRSGAAGASRASEGKGSKPESAGRGAKAAVSKSDKAGAVKPVAAKVAAVKVAASLAAKATAAKGATGKPAAKSSLAKSPIKLSPSKAPVRPKAPPKPRNPLVAKKIQKVNEERERRRDLSLPAERTGGTGKSAEVVKDRVVLLVRDPYWLQATWEVTRQSVQRAQAAMAEQWHAARPILRLLEVESSGTTSSAERVLREIAIHGGVHNWYIDVQDPPKGFRVELGYLSTNGKFFAITRSNTVTTPRPGSADSLDENWSDVEENYERIFAQSGGYSEETSSHELQEAFEEKLQRPIGPPLASRFGVGAERILRRKRDFQFDVEAEMVIHGTTKPDAHVTLSGEPVKLREDGSFAVRMALPDKRQVIPVVASSRDGGEQRTIVIAVERNTKIMEPMIRESSE